MPGPNLPPLVVLPSSPPPPPPKRRSTARYGLLYPLGIVGLALLAGWIAWFAYGAWKLRDVWQAIAVVHDTARPMAERLASAKFLADDPRATEDQIEPMVFESNLPMRVKIVLAGGLARPLTLQERLPRRMDRFETIPLAIRLALLMKMAETAEPGVRWDAAPLERMGAVGDESARLLSLYCRAAAFGSGQAAIELQEAADATGDGLASILSAALEGEGRADRLRQAARWLEANHRAIVEAGGLGPD